MENNHKSTVIALASIVVIFIFFLIGQRAEKLEQEVDKEETVRIAELKKTGVASTTYEIQGFVVGKYECPPCLETEKCQVCPNQKNAIIVDDSAPLTPESPLADSQITIFTDDTKQLDLGRRYELKILCQPGKNQKEFHLSNYRLIE